MREVMYVKGRGTWFLLRFTMDPPVEFHVVYNNDFDSKCSLNLTADEWALDLERLHRALGARGGQHQVPAIDPDTSKLIARRSAGARRCRK